MNNEQVMQLMADNGMHEGGMDNWVIDNAWVKFANLVEAAARADERGRMCKQCKECLNEKSTSNEANKPAFLGEGGQAN